MAEEDTLRTSATLLRNVCDLRNRAAWGTFVDRYRLLIAGWCRRQGLRHHDAEDVTSDVLAKLASAMPRFSYDPTQRFRGWLKAVVLNAVNDFLRKRARDGGGVATRALTASNEPVSADAGSADAGSADAAELITGLEVELRRDLALAREAGDLVRRRVEPQTWRAFECTAIDGRRGVDVARDLGASVASVHMAKSRVTRMLREQFAELEKPSRRGQERSP
jgi:RNA polymerase sigma factor (sigma-70 family)